MNHDERILQAIAFLERAPRNEQGGLLDPDVIEAEVRGVLTPAAKRETQAYGRKGQPLRFEASHAPKGGITVAGKRYTGGEFIPSEAIEQATPEERRKLDAKTGGGGKSKPKPAASEIDDGAIDLGGLETEEDPYQDDEGHETPRWDGTIDPNRVDQNSSALSIAEWNFYDDEGEHFPQRIRLRSGTYDPNPDDLDSEPVDVYRWESWQDDSGMTEAGSWTTDDDDAMTDGRDYGNENNMEEPEADEDGDDDDSDTDDDDDSDPVSYAEGSRRAVMNRWEELLPDHDIDDARELFGAPDGAKVELGYNSRSKTIDVTINHPKIEDMERTIGVDDEGNTYVHNDLFIVKPKYQGEGLGADVFAGQVAACAAAGVAYIETHAARGSTMNGYYTWPRFGYDQSIDDIEDDDRKLGVKLRAAFPDAESILDVMETKEGRDWWKKHGDSLLHARFDLSEGSRSHEVLNAYLRERKGK
jgi:hypothetical protein